MPYKLATKLCGYKNLFFSVKINKYCEQPTTLDYLCSIKRKLSKLLNLYKKRKDFDKTKKIYYQGSQSQFKRLADRVCGNKLLADGHDGIDQRPCLVRVRHPLLRDHRPEQLRRMPCARVRSLDFAASKQHRIK